MSDFADKLRSIQFAGKKAAPKVVTDHHDHHSVTVTTADERQDVTVQLHKPVNQMGDPNA